MSISTSERAVYSSVATDAGDVLSLAKNSHRSTSTSNNSNFQLVRRWKVFPGKNNFGCDGRLMLGRHPGLLYLTIVLIIGTTGLFLAFDCRFLTHRLTAIVPVVTLVLCVFVMAVLLRTALSDPGIIPRPSTQEAAFMEYSIDEHTTASGYIAPVRTRDVLINGHVVTLKYCFTCKIFRPPRSSHCGICDNCVERFDHHCPWVGNCVGLRNYRYFYMFLVSLSVYCLFILAFSITNIVLLSSETDFPSAFKQSPTSIVEAVLAFMSIWSVCGLAGFHSHLIACNITTNEDIKHKRLKSPSENIFDRGSLRSNFLEVVCGPIPPSVIDPRALVDAAAAAAAAASSLPRVSDIILQPGNGMLPAVSHITSNAALIAEA